MEKQSQAQGKPAIPSTFNLVPASILQHKRKFISARFPFGPPSFTKEEFVLSVDKQNANAAKQRDSRQGGPPAPAPPPALLLTNKAQQQQQSGAAAPKQLQGVPRTDAGNNYFVLMKGAGRSFSVYPLEATYTFKPLARPSSLTIEEVEAALRNPAAGAPAGADDQALLPKSMRRVLREEAAAEAADKRLKEEAVPLLKDKVAELTAKYANQADNKLVLGADDNSEESADMDDMGIFEDASGRAKRRKGKAGEEGAAPSARRRGAKGKQAGDPDTALPEDELAEDIYAGEEDELRPAAPTEDVDWEFDIQVDDDDLQQGASDEEGLDDDPGYRKELGLEGDEEEEEEEQAKREADMAADTDKDKKPDDIKDATAAPTAADGADAAGPNAANGVTDDADVDGVDEFVDMDEDDSMLLNDDDEDLDDDDLDRLAAETEAGGRPGLKRRKQNNSTAGRERSPAPAVAAAAAARRGATPPVGAVAAKGGIPGQGPRKGATPPPPAAATRAGTPPVGAFAKAAAAAGGNGGGGSNRRTPPPAGAGKRKTPPPASVAAAAGAGSGSGAKRRRDGTTSSDSTVGVVTGAGGQQQQQAVDPDAYVWSPEQLDLQNIPTTEGLRQAIPMVGAVPVGRLVQLLQGGLPPLSNDAKQLLKQRLLQVARVNKGPDGQQYMVLK